MRNAAVATANMSIMNTRLAMAPTASSAIARALVASRDRDRRWRVPGAKRRLLVLKLLGVIAAAHRDDRFRKVHDLGPRAPAKGSLRTWCFRAHVSTKPVLRSSFVLVCHRNIAGETLKPQDSLKKANVGETRPRWPAGDGGKRRARTAQRAARCGFCSRLFDKALRNGPREKIQGAFGKRKRPRERLSSTSVLPDLTLCLATPHFAKANWSAAALVEVVVLHEPPVEVVYASRSESSHGSAEGVVDVGKVQPHVVFRLAHQRRVRPGSHCAAQPKKRTDQWSAGLGLTLPFGEKDDVTVSCCLSAELVTGAKPSHHELRDRRGLSVSHPRIANRLSVVGLLRRDNSKDGKQAARVHWCAEDGLRSDVHSAKAARARAAELGLWEGTPADDTGHVRPKIRHGGGAGGHVCAGGLGV
eukprot:scaffold64933_cov66-Phaeocystis_antarctica.AAC.2